MRCAAVATAAHSLAAAALPSRTCCCCAAITRTCCHWSCQVFASFFTLSKNRSTTDLRWTAARVLLEFLQVWACSRGGCCDWSSTEATSHNHCCGWCVQLFRVVFNSTLAWKINRDLW